MSEWGLLLKGGPLFLDLLIGPTASNAQFATASASPWCTHVG